METHFVNMEQVQNSLARERVTADLRALIRDSEDLLQATAGDLSEKARDARNQVIGALERARVTFDALQEQSTATARAAARQADIVIRAHPYESLGVAFAVGLLVGILLTHE